MAVNAGTTRGFTLIEMLVALAIVAIAMSTISSGYVSMVHNTDSLKERTLARWIAENRIARLHIETPWPEIGVRDGSLEYAGLKWHWSETTQASPDPDFRRIQIEVRRDGNQNATLSMVSYARNPQPSNTGAKS